jgi:hypothetical protein
MHVIWQHNPGIDLKWPLETRHADRMAQGFNLPHEQI